jgi:hypothetical protein
MRLIHKVCAPEQEEVREDFRQNPGALPRQADQQPVQNRGEPHSGWRLRRGSLLLHFYCIDQQEFDGAITDDELTPLVIEDGVLAGWGWNFLDQNLEKYRIELPRQ